MKLSVKSGVQRFYSVKSLLQIGDNVVDVLCTDRKTDRVVKNLLLVKLLLRQLRVGGGLGVNHQGLYICHIGQQREQVQIVDEDASRILSALDISSASIKAFASFSPPLMSKVKMEPAPLGKYLLYRS